MGGAAKGQACVGDKTTEPTTAAGKSSAGPKTPRQWVGRQALPGSGSWGWGGEKGSSARASPGRRSPAIERWTLFPQGRAGLGPQAYRLGPRCGPEMDLSPELVQIRVAVAERVLVQPYHREQLAEEVEEVDGRPLQPRPRGGERRAREEQAQGAQTPVSVLRRAESVAGSGLGVGREGDGRPADLGPPPRVSAGGSSAERKRSGPGGSRSRPGPGGGGRREEGREGGRRGWTVELPDRQGRLGRPPTVVAAPQLVAPPPPRARGLVRQLPLPVAPPPPPADVDHGPVEHVHHHRVAHPLRVVRRVARGLDPYAHKVLRRQVVERAPRPPRPPPRAPAPGPGPARSPPSAPAAAASVPGPRGVYEAGVRPRNE